MTLRRRLVVGTCTAVAVSLAISGVLVYVLTQRALVARFDDALRAKARALATLVEQEGGVVEVEDVPREAPPGDAFAITSGGKRLLQSTSVDRDPSAIDRGRWTRLEHTPRSDEREGSARVEVVYAQQTDELDATIARIRNIIVGVGLGAIALVLGVLAWIVRAGLRPVDALAADIGGAQLESRISEERPAELVGIAKRTNELLERLERAFGRERQLTAEVAHELRTPLAGLRATIELALDRERTPERYREALARSLAITTQTERMVESMLSLAKLDAGSVNVELQRVELDVIVRDVVASHAARIRERELAVATNTTKVVTDSDPALLASVVHNLVDNAVSYSDARGSITVDVEAGGTIRVTNTGCTLADASHVFDRFWRGDAARTAGTHAGLGLAIAKRVVEVLGGTIEVCVGGGRFVATVVLPRTSETNVDSARAAP